MRLITLGGPFVVDGDREIPLQPLPLSLLAYLALGGSREREHLAELLWQDNAKPLNSLSTTLSRIRADVPNGIWLRGASFVGSDIATDIDDLRTATDALDVVRILDLYGGPFLSRLSLRRLSPEFEDWMLAERTTLATQVEWALLQGGSEFAADGRHREAGLTAARAWEIATSDGYPSPDFFPTYYRLLAQAANPVAAQSGQPPTNSG